MDSAVVITWVGVVILFIGGTLTAPESAAIWTIMQSKAQQYSHLMRECSCSAGVAVVTTSANLRNVQDQQSHTIHKRHSEWRHIVMPAMREMLICFSFPKKSSQICASGRTCNYEHLKTQTRTETTNNNRPVMC